METPCVEHIENLCSKQGGDNEKLIFKIMKRGEKLANASSEDELCDSGLRYDLTVPLSRYYSNNSAKLPSPFLAMQIGNVWRADRPQKGRYRQFTQCDIDVLGDESNLAEIEYYQNLLFYQSLQIVPYLQQHMRVILFQYFEIEHNHVKEIHDYLLNKLKEKFDDLLVNSPSDSTPYILNFAFKNKRNP